MTFLDGTVVNVALRTIGEDFDASLAELQWITNGYLLSMSSLILLGGSLGDRYGRRRIFVVGTVWFALASLLCGIAPSATGAHRRPHPPRHRRRAADPRQPGHDPGRLRPESRARAIGAWSGLGGSPARSGRSSAAPWSVRLLALDLLHQPAAGRRHRRRRPALGPRDPRPRRPARFDVVGAMLATIALGGITYALIEWGDPFAAWAAVIGVATAAGFLLVEKRSDAPDGAAGHVRATAPSAQPTR